MVASRITLTAHATGSALGLMIKFDDRQVFDSRDLSTEPQKISFEFDDSIEADHELTIEMYGKTTDHTQIGADGEILQDRCIELSDVVIDDISLGHIFTEQSRYHHDFNGTRDPVVDTFYGTMGCNGQVRLKFSSPVYIWLLENM